LKKLKTLGSVFCCENKIYDLNTKKIDDIDVCDFNPKHYLETVYSQIMDTVPGAKTLEWIPIGHSLGGYQAVGFSQIYSRRCLACILLDPLLFTKPNMDDIIPAFRSVLELKYYGSAKITQKILRDTREQIKTATKTQRQYYIDYLQYVYAFQLTKWTMQNITGTPFKTPVYSYINITEPEKPHVLLNPKEQVFFDPFFTNARKLVEVSILDSDPHFHFQAYLNQTHHLLHIPDIIKTVKNISGLGKK
jgi:hypothetical protein